jgi:predicted RNA-binding protein (virulence factor B family)
MSNTILQGKVSFVNHEKKYVMIEYDVNGKKKNINGVVDDKVQAQWIEKNIIKKKHHFHIGDTVNFVARLADRGDKMIADNIQYLYNTYLDMILNKAKTQNKFLGYLKMVDDKIFIKEIDTYLFFPVPLSPWQVKPEVIEDDEAVSFSLENIDKKDKVTAKLSNNSYISEFYTAVKHQKTKTPVEAKVYNITPHGVYVNFFNEKMQAKLPLIENEKLTVGDTITIQIVHIGDSRIVVERV